jgi:hypothetical protein
MYDVDERDRVRRIDDLPRPEAGAPVPLVFASEQSVWVAYFVSPIWQVPAGTTVDDRVALVTFRSARAHFFGPPNDEALAGHPLARRGLDFYDCFEVTDSSWIRRLERANRVHPQHSPELYAGDRHFVITFHDSTFECIARRASAELTTGGPGSAITRVLQSQKPGSI